MDNEKIMIKSLYSIYYNDSTTIDKIYSWFN
jgi:hypothetical protein